MRGNAIYVLYVDDYILTGLDLKELDKIFEDMKRVSLNLNIEGNILDFLGMTSNDMQDGTINLTRPHLINSILLDLGLQADSTKAKSMHASSFQQTSWTP